MAFRGITGEIMEERRSRGNLRLLWKIPRFLDLSRGVVDHHDSPTFYFHDARWQFRVYPNLVTSRRVALCLYRDYDERPSIRTMNVTVGLSASGGEVKWRSEQEKCHFEKGTSWPLGTFCTVLELRDRGHRLMPGGTLTFMCTMKIPRTTATGGEKDLEDFAKLLASGEGSDVTLQVSDVQFRVHSAVLFARCPALAISLRHESREKASGKIVVEDCEPGVFGDFLDFLYTGSVRSLTERNVFGLYRVADKYLVEELKLLCSEHIPNTLSVRTFSDAVRLALMHDESDMLERAVAFAARNVLSILRSAEWQNFSRECPKEANEVLRCV